MAEIFEDIISGTVSTFTPLGCVRNCLGAVFSIIVLYILLTIVFVFVQGGIQ